MSVGNICHGSKNTLINPTETKVCHFGHGATMNQTGSLKTVNKWEKNMKAKSLSKKSWAANYLPKCYLMSETLFPSQAQLPTCVKTPFPFLKITTSLLTPGNCRSCHNHLILCIRSSAFSLLSPTDTEASHHTHTHTQPYKQRFEDKRVHVVYLEFSPLRQQESIAGMNSGCWENTGAARQDQLITSVCQKDPAMFLRPANLAAWATDGSMGFNAESHVQRTNIPLGSLNFQPSLHRRTLLG